MMNDRLFNTPFEMGLRIIMLLSAAPKKSFSVDRIIALDFITSYASDFRLPFANLHGENNFRYSEIVGRRLLVQEAVKKLVTEGMLDVTVDRGYFFSISDAGKKYAKKLKSTYATEYVQIAKEAVKKYKDNTDEGILATIQNHAVNAVRG